jgi:hypothetical protein
MAKEDKEILRKRKLKQQARSAASQGNFTKDTARDLRKAGVNQTAIQNIRSTQQQFVQGAQQQAAVEAARQGMNPAVDTAMRNQANQGLNIGQQFYDSPEFQDVLKNAGGDLTADQIAEYAKSQGFGLGDQWMQQYGTLNAGKIRLNEAKNLAQALRISAARGKAPNLINRKELNYMTDEFGKSGLQILGRMDKLNEKGTARGMNPLGIKSGLYNKIFSGKYGDTSYRPFGKYDGPLAENLFAMYDSRTPRGANQEGSVTPGAGKMPKGFGVFGRYNGQPIFSQGVGKNWSDTKFGADQTSTYTPFFQPETSTEPVTSEEPVAPEDPAAVDVNQGGLGGDVASFATGWKGARSARKQKGRKAQGYQSMRIAPSYSAGIGSNFG